MKEICLDTETTGLSKSEDRIVEIGCVEIENKIPTGRYYHVYINPKRTMPIEAERVHGLSSDFLRGKPVFRQVVSEFLEFIGDTQLVIHNASFDLGMLNAELERCNRPHLKNPVVDTLALSRKVRPGKGHKLDAICRDYKIDITKRTKHGALLDSEILAAAYLQLTGGQQYGMGSLLVGGGKSSASDVGELSSDAPLRTFKSRISVEESNRHTDFVKGIGETAIWHSYIDCASDSVPIPEEPDMRLRRRTGHLGMSDQARSERGLSIGGSDARVIMSGDQEAIERLWREKRGEAPGLDFSDVLLVQMGNVIEPLVLDWFEGETGLFVTNEQERCTSEEFEFASCTLDGRVRQTEDGDVIGIFEAKFMMPFRWSLEDAIEKYMPQFQWNMFVTGTDRCWAAIITGAAVFAQVEIEADPVYQAHMVSVVSDFWDCVKSGKVPGNPVIEAPKPDAIRVVDMRESNAWAEQAGTLLRTMDGYYSHESAKKSLKAMMPDDAKEARGHGVSITRSKTGRMAIKIDDEALAQERERVSM